jgi:CDP-glycerol glycerophosphotransferase
VPIVSVVVIGYNDAEHLPTAVQSVMRQTLRDVEILVVDDASTDDTPAVAAALAAADDRVQVMRLDHNSGGCSRPRNVGMSQASGRYLMFLDSDDVLPRRACERLVSAVESVGAEVGCGRAVRRHLHPRRYISRYDDLYTRARVLNGIAEMPGLLYDTTCWNKIYRRDFVVEQGMQFPEGMLYEDLPFTAHALLAARRIAVVPDLVYVWHGRRAADAQSITIRRDVRSWHDRIEANRLIDKVFAEVGADDSVRAIRARKFLDKDMDLFLREVREFPPHLRREIVTLVGDYVRETSAAQADGSLPGRVAAFLTSVGDVEGTIAVADWSANGGVATDLTVSGDRVYWTASHLDEPGGRAALDVTTTGWRTAAFARTPFLASATTVAHADGRLHVAARVADLLGRLDGVTAATVRLRGRAGTRILDVPAEITADVDHLRVDADIDLRAVAARLFNPAVGHEIPIAVVLHRHAERAERPLSGRDADLPVAELHLPGPWRHLAGDRARVVESNGRLVLSLSALPASVDAMHDAASLLRYGAQRARLRWSDRRRRLDTR